MEFVSDSEVLPLLRESGITAEKANDEMIRLRMADDPSVVRYILRVKGRTLEPENAEATIVELDEALMISTLIRVLHRLHLDQLVVIPISRWAKVLDAVAYAMAEDEQWLEFDATATVERNTRDPLLCLPADFHSIETLVKALITDADQADQGLMLTSAASPVILEIVPGVGARLTIGARALADEVADAISQ